MPAEVSVALVGDRSDAILAHRAIPMALELAGSSPGIRVRWDWRRTASITPETVRAFEEYGAMWCVPASPYESEAGALEAIRFARESGRPFLGTCGGRQHAILEYARNVLGLRNAEHAEVHPDALLPLIAPLSCALVEANGSILQEHLLAGSALRITGRDSHGGARAFELTGHPFFLLTQFQPERRALSGTAPPLVSAFVSAAA
jgi:CTP synthase (UTP-ammonia lyase)